MGDLSIGQVAKQAGVAASTIRYYEAIGLLPTPQRVSGKRRYDEGIFQKLNLILMAKSAGLRIEEIQTLLHEFPEGTLPSARWGVLANAKIKELNQRIVQIERMKSILIQTLQCDCPTLDDCVVDMDRLETIS